MTCAGCSASISIGVRCLSCAKALAKHRDALAAEMVRHIGPPFNTVWSSGQRARRR
jgi:hypothetical protein